MSASTPRQRRCRPRRILQLAWRVTQLGLCETLLLGEVVAEIPSSQEIHDEVEVLAVLKGGLHVDEESSYDEGLRDSTHV